MEVVEEMPGGAIQWSSERCPEVQMEVVVCNSVAKGSEIFISYFSEACIYCNVTDLYLPLQNLNNLVRLLALRFEDARSGTCYSVPAAR
jgi:hypothetical protein